jgi:hypothetical protein
VGDRKPLPANKCLIVRNAKHSNGRAAGPVRSTTDPLWPGLGSVVAKFLGLFEQRSNANLIRICNGR